MLWYCSCEHGCRGAAAVSVAPVGIAAVSVATVALMPQHCNRGVAAVGIATVLLQAWHHHLGIVTSLLWHCNHVVTALGIAVVCCAAPWAAALQLWALQPLGFCAVGIASVRPPPWAPPPPRAPSPLSLQCPHCGHGNSRGSPGDPTRPCPPWHCNTAMSPWRRRAQGYPHAVSPTTYRPQRVLCSGSG